MKKLLFLVLLGGIAIGAGGAWLALKPPKIRNPVTVLAPGLYRSGQLEPSDLAHEIERRGIKTVINLGSSQNTDAAVCEVKGIQYISIPAGDVWQMAGLPNPEHGGKVFPKPDTDAVWRAIEGATTQPVLFHCWGGTHRTGLVAAMYRIQYQGWDPDDAIAEMRLYGFDDKDPKFANVLDYLRRLSRGTAGAATSQPVR
jgi:protein tyrosine phosphatase (PTP) superfamily phosphohydrolase (DUF442 family)